MTMVLVVAALYRHSCMHGGWPFFLFHQAFVVCPVGLFSTTHWRIASTDRSIPHKARRALLLRRTYRGRQTDTDI